MSETQLGLNDNEPVISGFVIASEEERTEFLPSISKMYYLRLENLYYNVLSKSTEAYSGGHHEFITLPNGAKTMLFGVLNDKKVEVTGLANHFHGFMTFRALSGAAFMLACNHLGNMLYSEGRREAAKELFENCEKLQEMLYTHEMFADEVAKIYQFLD